MDADEVAPARLSAQLLSPPGVGGVEEVVDRLLGVQAQDARAFRLALRARSHGTTAADVDAALTDRRAVVVSWLFRGTLQLVGARDYWWLHSLSAPRIVADNRRRLAQLGVDEVMARRGVQVVLDAVREAPRTRAELGAVLDAEDVTTAGQALVHVLVAATLHGHLVRGPVRDGDHCFVDAEQWLDRAAVPDRDECLEMLARRYLAGHGPAAPGDLAAYSGLTLTDARRAFDRIDAETRPVDGNLRALADDRDAAALPPPRLLGMFDPVLHGWADRTWVTGPHKDEVTRGGLFRATALVEGRAAATWTLPGGVLTLAPLRRLTPAEVDALEDEAADVLRFLGLPPAPLAVMA